MNELTRRTLYWAPRVISILFIAFLSMFALDVFGHGLGFWRTLLALTMHLVPSFVLILVLILAWRWEWIGAVLYAAAGGLYILWVPRALPTPVKISWILTIAGPAFLLAALFLVSWLKRNQLRATH